MWGTMLILSTLLTIVIFQRHIEIYEHWVRTVHRPGLSWLWAFASEIGFLPLWFEDFGWTDKVPDVCDSISILWTDNEIRIGYVPICSVFTRKTNNCSEFGWYTHKATIIIFFWLCSFIHLMSLKSKWISMDDRMLLLLPSSCNLNKQLASNMLELIHKHQGQADQEKASIFWFIWRYWCMMSTSSTSCLYLHV